uniref:Sfi1 spindle body domain-containing protein n=1 Tax=Cacopsylla melanoneura TaxID=428564 RepID=A0A8D9AMP0_9HEMI
MRIYLRHWREELMLEQRNQEKTTLALIHWSKELTRKAFTTWTQYTKEKNLKKLRYSEAMEQHKSFVLIEGLKSLLQKGTKELVQRNEKAMENAKQNEDMVFKYFTRWRRCVRFNEDVLVNKVVPLPLNLHREDKQHTKQTGGENLEVLQRSVRFSNTPPIPRNEPKIPQFLTACKYR